MQLTETSATWEYISLFKTNCFKLTDPQLQITTDGSGVITTFYGFCDRNKMFIKDIFELHLSKQREDTNENSFMVYSPCFSRLLRWGFFWSKVISCFWNAKILQLCDIFYCLTFSAWNTCRMPLQSWHDRKSRSNQIQMMPFRFLL